MNMLLTSLNKLSCFKFFTLIFLTYSISSQIRKKYSLGKFNKTVIFLKNTNISYLMLLLLKQTKKSRMQSVKEGRVVEIRFNLSFCFFFLWTLKSKKKEKYEKRIRLHTLIKFDRMKHLYSKFIILLWTFYPFIRFVQTGEKNVSWRFYKVYASKNVGGKNINQTLFN